MFNSQSAFLFALFIHLGFASVSQNCTNANISGDATFSGICTDDASWSGSTYNNNVQINVGNGESFNFDIPVTINGNLTLNGSGSNPLVIFSASSVTVTGNVIINANNYDFSVTGTLIVQGNIDNNSNNVDYTITGELDVTGNIDNGNNTDFGGDGIVRADNISNGNNNLRCLGAGNVVGTCDLSFDISGTCSPSSDFCTDAAANALPVGLTSFTISEFDMHSSLKWNVLFELNCASYEIWGLNQVGEKTLLGTYDCRNSANGYEYAVNFDELLSERYLSLTIVQIDNDGTKHVLKTISTNQSSTQAATSVQVFPNPSSGKIFIQSSEPIQRISVTDLNGIQLPYSIINLHPAEPVIQMEHTGLYLMQIQTTLGTDVFKLVIH